MDEVKNISHIPVEDLLDKVGSLYKLVVLASRRAGELNQGGQRLVDINPKTKISTIALEEIREGKVTYKEGKEKK